MSKLITISNRESGQSKTGSWTGLRKSFGYEEKIHIPKLRQLFEDLGWDVVSEDESEPVNMASAGAHRALTDVQNLAGANNMKNLAVKTQSDNNVLDLHKNADTGNIKSSELLRVPQGNPDYHYRPYDTILKAILGNTNQEHPALIGGAGTGKTEMVKQYCADHDLPYTRISLDESMSLQYIIGRLWFKDGEVFFKEGLLVKAMQEPGVIFLDEFNSMLPSKTFFCHQFLDSGEVYIPEADKYFHKHPQCKIVLAGNNQNGIYTGVQKINGAYFNRLAPIEIGAIEVEKIKLKTVKGDELKELRKFYTETTDMLQAQNSRALITARNLLRFDNLRGCGLEIKDAMEIAFISAVRYVDPTMAEQMIINAKGHFGL